MASETRFAMASMPRAEERNPRAICQGINLVEPDRSTLNFAWRDYLAKESRRRTWDA